MAASKEEKKTEGANGTQSDIFRWSQPTKSEIVDRSVQQLRVELREISKKAQKLTKRA